MVTLGRLFGGWGTATSSGLIKESDPGLRVLERYASLYPVSSLVKAIAAKKLPPDHPFSKKVNELMHGSQSSKSPEVLEVESPFKVELSQGAMSPDDFMNLIKEKGSYLTSLEVTNPNDDLFKTIALYCENLTTFVYNQAMDNLLGTFSAVGLMCITQLSKLTTLHFETPGMNLTEDDINTFLSSPVFLNLVHLKFCNGWFSDKSYEIVSKYSKLESLFLAWGIDVKLTSTLENNPLPLTLKKFTFVQGSEPSGLLSDKFLNSLPIGLTHLSLNASWANVTIDGFTTALNRLSDLTGLGVHGSPISRKIVSGLTSPLTSLHLGDCKELEEQDYVCLLTKQSTLTELSIGNGLKFSSSIVLPNLTSLYLEAPNLGTYPPPMLLPELPHTLKKVTLVNIRLFYDGFSPLAKLPNLEYLEVVHTLGFNTGSLRPIVANVHNKLRHIRLSGVSVDGVGLTMLGNCPHLETIILANCPSISRQDLEVFLSNTSIANSCRNLYLQGFDLTSDMSSLFTPFVNLKVFYFGDNLSGDPGPIDIEKNPTLKGRTITFDWFGKTAVPFFKRIIR